MFASIRSATIVGVKGVPIRVEVHTSRGFPGYTVVGMPDVSMREGKERIRAALLSSRQSWPESRITVNLAPANVRKSGTGAELAILVGLLCTSGVLETKRFNNVGVIGELGLDGSIRPVFGTIARVLALKQSGAQQVFVPVKNAYEASLVQGIEVFPISNVSQLIASLTEGEPWPDYEIPKDGGTNHLTGPDYIEVSGQPIGCEAMELCAAGGHHTLLMGSPGIGKTMLAERIVSILPELNIQESYEVSAIASIFKSGVSGLVTHRPFCAPHHTSSVASMIGGGSNQINPGEITRAHRGILFLDELSEFSQSVLESLRQPLEKGSVSISRSAFHAIMPADFTLVACSNPCPCAKTKDKCICSDLTIAKYIRKLSGPLLDRFDIRVELFKSSLLQEPSHSSGEMKDRICLARERQNTRNITFGSVLNSRLNSNEIREIVSLDSQQEKFFKEKLEKREISGRGATAILRLSRTLADLDDEEKISDLHLARAFDFREEVK